MVTSFAANPASCWSSKGDIPSGRPGCSNARYRGWRAKIHTSDRNAGTIDCTMR